MKAAAETLGFEVEVAPLDKPEDEEVEAEVVEVDEDEPVAPRAQLRAFAARPRRPAGGALPLCRAMLGHGGNNGRGGP